MKRKLLALLLLNSSLIVLSQECNQTATTVTECAEISWIWTPSAVDEDTGDCIQGGLNIIICSFLEGNYGFPNVWAQDSWECCCERVALEVNDLNNVSFSGYDVSGYEGSACEDYVQLQPPPNHLSIDYYQLNPLKEIYIDLFGRKHLKQPKGISVKNGQTYYKL
jgi:hypothetical protein